MIGRITSVNNFFICVFLIILEFNKDKNKKNLLIKQYIFNFAYRLAYMKVESAMAADFFSKLSAARNIVIAGHLNPDGDCIGCLTGMKAWIESAVRGSVESISMIVPNVFPDYLKFMPGASQVLDFSLNPSAAEALIEKADTVICMDLNNLARTEGMAGALRLNAGQKILIDHHPQPEDFADLVFSETEVSSASELTWWLLSEVSVQFGKEIPFDTKTSLYTGMMTDTNNFCNSVFPSTFLMASQIAQAGVDRERIQFEIMNSFSEQRMRLMGEMLLNRMKMFKDLKAASMVLDKAVKDSFDYRDGDSEGFVNLPLKIKDVEISALFTQSDGYIKVSLRSKGAVSVNQLCRRYFNGGGHERAAGGRLYMPVEEVEDYFERSLRAFLEENRHSF